MPKRFHIMRGDTKEERRKWPCWRRGLAEGVKTATVSCPLCGEWISLSTFDIDPNGRVSPSLACPHKACTFHEFIVLENWT